MESSSREIVYSRTSLRIWLILSCAAFSVAALISAQARSPINLDILSRDGYGVVTISSPSSGVSTDRLEVNRTKNQMVVRGMVNGRPANLVVDTGWGGGTGVYLDSTFAKTLKLPMQGGGSVGYSVSGNAMSQQKAGSGTVVLGNVQLNGVPFFAGQIKGLTVTETREGFWMNGVVGRGFLHAASAVLDISNHRVYLRPPGRGRAVSLGPALKAAGFAEIPFTIGNYGCLVDVEINGQSGKMILDTGAAFSHLDERFTSQFKAGTYETYTGTVDASGVVDRNRAAQFQTINLAGVKIRVPEDIGVGKLSFYSPGNKVVGLLGMDIVGYNLGIIDLGNQKLYLVPAK